MTSIAFVDAIGRQFRRPVLGASEYVELALLTFFFASLALVVRDDSQIRVGLFADLYKPRLAAIERVFTGVVETLVLIGIAYMIFDQAGRLSRFGTVTYFLKIPVAPWVFGAAVMCVIAVWFGILNLTKLKPQPTPRPHALPEGEN
ncbi:TRAP transporter small permease subunit [Pelagibacterium xiamenense]|uniref:TRAP transporter small permease subunit n=1 Tax=Pelagibacterium xiamenense TaxID=2901140 RepID=UPI001E54D621|nr:TRAP transporter small permease subunit [Pelagibacterium xiamenense]MCD7058629.1 TRAP transporter small permease subunit [Pelagibacterium xiamenense]